MVTITQEVDLSLTDNLIPPIVHVKQYDSMARKVLCSIFDGNAFLSLDSESIITVSGTRPDGEIFQYSSETAPDVVSVEDGKAAIWVTDVMTGAAGKTAVDVGITDGMGSLLGVFSFILHAERASLENKALAAGSYSSTLQAVADTLMAVYINDDGYIVIETSDMLGLAYSVDGNGVLSVDYN